MGTLPLRSSLHITGNSQLVQLDATEHVWFSVVFLQDNLLHLCFFNRFSIHLLLVLFQGSSLLSERICILLDLFLYLFLSSVET